MDNALLLVVGYTESTGSQELKQALSEKRAGGVVNYLQQACGWKPYRMLTPTGMAEADPTASNDTVEGKAPNRRVAVNNLVSKGLDGLKGTWGGLFLTPDILLNGRGGGHTPAHTGISEFRSANVRRGRHAGTSSNAIRTK